MKLFLLSIFIALFSNSAFSDEMIKASTPTLCTADERILFSCQLWNKKVVSFCSSREDLPEPFVEYRYGSTQKIELQYQVSTKHPKNKIFLEEKQQSFENKPSYTLFFQNNNYGYSLNIPYAASTDEYDNPRLFVNSPNFSDADWNEYGCLTENNGTKNNFIIDLSPKPSQLTNATTRDFQKWVKKFGKRSYMP